MTNQVQDSQFESVLELLSYHGFDGMREAMETLFNEAMKIERAAHLGADRSDARQGHANGY